MKPSGRRSISRYVAEPLPRFGDRPGRRGQHLYTTRMYTYIYIHLYIVSYCTHDIIIILRTAERLPCFLSVYYYYFFHPRSLPRVISFSLSLRVLTSWQVVFFFCKRVTFCFVSFLLLLFFFLTSPKTIPIVVPWTTPNPRFYTAVVTAV